MSKNLPFELPISRYAFAHLCCKSSEPDSENRFIPGCVVRFVKENYDGDRAMIFLLSQLVYWFSPARGDHDPDNLSEKSFRLKVVKKGYLWWARSREDMAEDCFMSLKELKNRLKILKDDGIIEIGHFLFNNLRMNHVRLLPQAMDAIIFSGGPLNPVADPKTREPYRDTVSYRDDLRPAGGDDEKGSTPRGWSVVEGRGPKFPAVDDEGPFPWEMDEDDGQDAEWADYAGESPRAQTSRRAVGGTVSDQIMEQAWLDDNRPRWEEEHQEAEGVAYPGMSPDHDELDYPEAPDTNPTVEADEARLYELKVRIDKLHQSKKNGRTGKLPAMNQDRRPNHSLDGNITLTEARVDVEDPSSGHDGVDPLWILKRIFTVGLQGSAAITSILKDFCCSHERIDFSEKKGRLEFVLAEGNRFLGYLDPEDDHPKTRKVSQRLMASLRQQVLNDELLPGELTCLHILKYYGKARSIRSWGDVLYRSTLAQYEDGFNPALDLQADIRDLKRRGAISPEHLDLLEFVYGRVDVRDEDLPMLDEETGVAIC
ncbi:hypothetical protein H5P28_10605 [Ruficoccus amylovorans]|uniref:Uncharacterized protein n=1 Tax=Ruficoccus amylovorans TaxID=1804625 RepID=A0A842HHJ9_9BACT|nr:hypothetical protein [Ruficoccus amylovorans]MBC2594711.1 hypothetical protein [Ruficoccus amylovorans]